MTTKILLPTRKLNSYGITEQKKTELDQLTNEVVVAQNEVTQLQAIVTSLQAKSTQFQGYLATSEANKDKALSNKNEMDALILSINNLLTNSDIAFTEIVLADSKTKSLASQMKVVMDKLIYSAEVVDRLSNLIIRKKAINPLISDELVTLVTTAGTDANNAVALTLVALNACFAAQASALEAEASCALEYTEILKLNEMITGTNPQGEPSDDNAHCLQTLIDNAWTKNDLKYIDALAANNEVLKQLSEMQGELSKATINMNSLKSALAAANAAALAS